MPDKAGWLKKNGLFAVLMLLLTVFRIALSRSMLITFSPGSIYDDLMQIGKAFSIAGGDWLGGYGSMTLVKGAGFPLLTAFFHWLGIPYIMAYHSLYILSCLMFMAAVAPKFIKSKWAGGLCYIFLIFNPIAFSAQLTRLYRDIGYYAVAFFCVSAFLGFLLRYDAKNAGIVFAAAGGGGLAAAHNFREDSHWLYIYAAGCTVVWLIFRYSKAKQRETAGKEFLKRTAIMPAVMLAAWAAVMLPVAGMNLARYGTFTVDEYNSGAYARAFGALKRIDGGTADPRIVIPLEMRTKLYELSPAFAELYSMLDAPDAPYAVWKEVQGEYLTGYFSFVLRDAAASLGYFESAEKANAYFERLADEVNTLCDTGAIDAGSERYGITARYEAGMFRPILYTTLEGMQETLRCSGIDPIPQPTAEDEAYYLLFENFVHDTIAGNRTAEDGRIIGNYYFFGVQLLGRQFLMAAVAVYRAVLPLFFPAALILYGIAVFSALRKKRADAAFWAEAAAALSLLFLFALRSAMIAFVHISSFPAIYTPAYQAAGYPLALAFIAASVLFFIKYGTKRSLRCNSCLSGQTCLGGFGNDSDTGKRNRYNSYELFQQGGVVPYD